MFVALKIRNLNSMEISAVSLSRSSKLLPLLIAISKKYPNTLEIPMQFLFLRRELTNFLSVYTLKLETLSRTTLMITLLKAWRMNSKALNLFLLIKRNPKWNSKGKQPSRSFKFQPKRR